MPCRFRRGCRRNILAISPIVGKAERHLIDNADEALRPAAMLRIGLALGIGRGEIGRIDGSKKGGQVSRDPCAKPPFSSIRA